MPKGTVWTMEVDFLPVESNGRFLNLFVPSFPKSKFSVAIVEQGQIRRSLELTPKPSKFQGNSSRIYMKYIVSFSTLPEGFLEIEQFVDSRIEKSLAFSMGTPAELVEVVFDSRPSISKVNKFSFDEIRYESWNYQVDDIEFELASGKEVGSIFIRGVNTEFITTFSLVQISGLIS